MAIQTLKRLWKNEYFQTAITIILILLIVFGLYYGAQAALGSEYPLLAVSSESMFPTLNIGDLIIVQKIDPAQINDDPINGDILVYKSGEDLIVHRAIDKKYQGDGVWQITTRGDAYPKGSGETWYSTQLVGKVIGRIPAIGNMPLFLHSEKNMYILFIALIIILIILMLPWGSKSEETPIEKDKKKVEEKKIFSMISLNLVFYIIINAVLVALIIFSLWGSLTFWQPGAGTHKPPEGRWVTIYGMFSDLNFHERLAGEANLSQSFLTYQIDYEVGGETRFGVPTFSWFQFLLIILVVYNAWKLHNVLKSYKMWEPTMREASV
ncbi:MAG: signal peptidase I [Candidatus Bathyarchaeia archaeon]